MVCGILWASGNPGMTEYLECSFTRLGGLDGGYAPLYASAVPCTSCVSGPTIVSCLHATSSCLLNSFTMCPYTESMSSKLH